MLAPLARMRRKQAPRPTLQFAALPAPVGGLNAVDAGSAMPLSDCTQLYNLIPAEYGLRSRLGSREHLTGLTGAVDNQIRSLFYYHGSAGAGTADRIFAVTSRGIYDVTTSRAGWVADTAYTSGDVVINDDGKVYTSDTTGTSDSSGGPTGTGANIVDGTTRWDYTTTIKKLAFSDPTGVAGRGIFHAFVGTAGHYLAYCDEKNGYHLYAESTDAWATGSVTGVTAANLCFVTSWKGRLWFAEKDTANAWYLALQAISGTATKLNLDYAAKFLRGGDLVGMWSWTGDGGVGIDDHIVFISRGGDVAVYVGTDPGDALTFSLRGTWSVGGIPAGRHVASSFGGDLLLLTKNGIRPISVLVNGGAEGSGQYVTKKISNLFNSLMLSRSSLHGWAMYIHPEDNALVVTHPTTDGANTEQVVMSLANGAWTRYDGLPIFSAASGGGKLYFGSVGGTIYINDGYVDGLTLAAPDTFRAIDWRVLSAFTDLQSPQKKRVQVIRPMILSDGGEPSVSVGARYDYNLTGLDAPSADLVGPGEWDGATWDADIWGGDYAPSMPVRGATGVGTAVAIGVRGTATARTVLVKIDVGYDVGGFL